MTGGQATAPLSGEVQDRTGEDFAAARPHLTRAHLLDLLTEMLRIRRFEDRCAELYTYEKIRGFLHLYDGEEAIAAGAMRALGPEDWVVATYREHGHALARGVPMPSVMAELFGKAEGSSRGRGGSMHIFDRARNFLGGNAIVGGGLPLAVGIALAKRMRGEPGLAACFFGEGAAAEGSFHESLNLAALWKLPVLFVCENNLYAMGTALRLSESQTEIAEKAASYKLPAQAVDGMDVIAVEAAVRRAAHAIRDRGGPQFVEAATYRFRAHSMFDAQLYREKEEVERWRAKDPIARLRAWMEQSGSLHPDDLAGIEGRVEAEIDEAVAFAEAAAPEPVEDLLRFVHSEPEGAR
jgi:pyruvate dehydrogenase E1 component alpha subunit